MFRAVIGSMRFPPNYLPWSDPGDRSALQVDFLYLNTSMPIAYATA